VKSIDEVMMSVYERDYVTVDAGQGTGEVFLSQAQLEARITQLGLDMRAAAANLEFEKAAGIRDEIKKFRTRAMGVA
jgi:excinuclease ABC subunit B